MGRVLNLQWRPVFDQAAVRHELRTIRDDLHCNAVRLCGRDPARLTAAGEEALRLGLEVWYCPELWNRPPAATLRYLATAARAAEQLRRRWPDRVVLSVATEASMFVRGIIPGRTLARRTANAPAALRAGRHTEPLARFLAGAARVARAEFGGALTYASLPFERVDWAPFDFVGVDHYRYAPTEAHYESALRHKLAHGKPVVVLEFGMRTYRDAEHDPTMLIRGITNWGTVALNRVPVLGRLVRPRLLRGEHVRDEEYQARRVVEDLTILDAAGVDGTFVTQFVEPMSPYSPSPRHDLDMNAFALVRTLPDGSWQPKAAFHAVAGFYASTSARNPVESRQDRPSATGL
ncbi:hypothetical protein GCM10010170_073160 [Dactylosporangium salmoneum]|uniref:Abortive infection protein n=1 Tax=Dactylosporangium salmoneum TaxID=53361 RepID=A0ABN3H8F8_9ACTN